MRLTLTAMVLLATGLAGCGGDYEAPEDFAVSESTVSNVVVESVNNTSTSPGIDGDPIVFCSSRMNCGIKYTVKEPTGIDRDTELVEPTRQIWAALFSDPQFDFGKITVEGPTISVGGKEGSSALFTLRCDREAAEQIDWEAVDADGLRQLCEWEEFVSPN